MDAQKRIYGLLTKYPEPGRVKTRLAKEVGQERAAEIYRRIAGRVCAETSPPGDGYRRIVFYSPEYRRGDFEEWLKAERLLPQRGKDIGEIMANALRDLFRLGAEKAVITGADIPGLHRGLINEAFGLLERSDVVVGPALDGGYYLIGMKILRPEIFHEIPWGTGRVYQKTLEVIREQGLSPETLATLSDIDSEGDLARAGILIDG